MTSYFPEGKDLDRFIKRRQQKGIIWRSLFLLATTIGVVILMILLITIIDDSMGYVAIQYKMEPRDLVVDFYQDIVLDAPNVQTSDDMDQLAGEIARDPNAIGILSEAAYQVHADALRAVGITDASLQDVVVVVSQENGWVQEVSSTELIPLFAVTETWSEVRSNWPDAPINRYLPQAGSAALETFIAQTYGDDPATQPVEALLAMLAQNVSAGKMRQLADEKPLATRSQEEYVDLITELVLQPTVVETWSLFNSIFHKNEIVAEASQIPNANLTFHRWITWDFITSPQSSRPEYAGVRTAILGSLWVVFITLIFSVPVGIGAAIYLEEYGSGGRMDQFIENNINNLAGVPSIIYGMLGLAVFVRAMEPLTSGSLFGLADPTTANGRTILAAGLTLGLLILPIIIINAREAIRAVPRAFREASYGLGATKWQTIWHHVLPNAIPGILTGSILAISRAFGETAPLVVVGASTAIFMDPSGPFSKFTTLPIQIYQWTSRPQAAFQNLAAAAIIVLLVLLLALNAVAVLLRNKYQRSY
jgi:phosphate transport system permease protein